MKIARFVAVFLIASLFAIGCKKQKDPTEIDPSKAGAATVVKPVGVGVTLATFKKKWNDALDGVLVKQANGDGAATWDFLRLGDVRVDGEGEMRNFAVTFGNGVELHGFIRKDDVLDVVMLQRHPPAIEGDRAAASRTLIGWAGARTCLLGAFDLADDEMAIKSELGEKPGLRVSTARGRLRISREWKTESESEWLRVSADKGGDKIKTEVIGAVAPAAAVVPVPTGDPLVELKTRVRRTRNSINDDSCTSDGKPAYGYNYSGATYDENERVALADSCVHTMRVLAAGHTATDNWYCCPK